MQRDWRRAQSEKDIKCMYRVLESMVRSLNNLEERFHQSYFFYLLTSINSFMPISHYSAILALWVGSFVVLWAAQMPFVTIPTTEDLLQYALCSFLWRLSPYAAVAVITSRAEGTLMMGAFIAQVVFTLALEDIVVGLLAAIGANAYAALRYCTKQGKESVKLH